VDGRRLLPLIVITGIALMSDCYCVESGGGGGGTTSSPIFYNFFGAVCGVGGFCALMLNS
jgi:hypothetical protein